MKYNKRIDVIIPAYNVEDKILIRCLSSIAMQINVSDLDITIVDDASTHQNYKAIAKMFKPVMNVKVLRYEENGGPGVARQYGLDNTSNGYITFIDADDTLQGAYALVNLLDGMNVNGHHFAMCVGVFDEIHDTPEDQRDGNLPQIFLAHEQDMIWMFGKMYSREYIDTMNIHFHETSRANEDNGFNTLIRLTASEQNGINFIPLHVYYWMNTSNSITRINDNQYSFGSTNRDSFYGYAENMIYAIKEARIRSPYNGGINQFAVEVMLNLYEYYIECIERSPENADKNYEYCVWYYNEIFKKIHHTIPDNVLAYQYSIMMKANYMSDKLIGFVPKYTIYEFLDRLENDCKNKEAA